MILAQNWPKTAKSSWHCPFKLIDICVQNLTPECSNTIQLGAPKNHQCGPTASVKLVRILFDMNVPLNSLLYCMYFRNEWLQLSWKMSFLEIKEPSVCFFSVWRIQESCSLRSLLYYWKFSRYSYTHLHC